ncbi:MAG: hypothetical protein PHN32_07260 [Actinomycetota bacterium]|nr:hypothetical protein [Actinomycetota bacterium]
MNMEDKIKYVLENTEVLILPQKYLSTSGSTTMSYFIVSEPLYKEFEGESGEEETVVRQGKITWEKPKLITPSYMLRLEGFSPEAQEALKMLAKEDSDLALILYNLKFIKSAEQMEIVSKPITAIAENIESQINNSQDQACGLIKGVDEFWDISLFKFIQEVITYSAQRSHLPEMFKKNYINLNAEGKPVLARDRSGIPVAVRLEVDKKFKQFEKGEIDAGQLKNELDRWDIYAQYEDRFLHYFKNS